ncbi:hypothetical protein D3C76_1636440 [compost metagenome]
MQLNLAGAYRFEILIVMREPAEGLLHLFFRLAQQNCRYHDHQNKQDEQGDAKRPSFARTYPP